MAYQDKDQKKNHRHTVRFRKEDDQLITLLANRMGAQKATLIQNMALMSIERELHRLGLGKYQGAVRM